jgi:quinol monooxygenase YgiN
MVIRIATFDKKPAPHDDAALMNQFRAWMKSQPGFRSAWHTSDSKTGKAMSISVWDDMASMMAMKDRKFPGPPMNVKPDSVQIYDEVEEF